MHSLIPPPDEWERLLNIFALNVFRYDARGQRLYLQRTILVTSKVDEVLTEQLDSIMVDLQDNTGDEYFYELLPSKEFHTLKKPQTPYDSSVISVANPLTLAMRSPRTGEVYFDTEMGFCPYTSSPLRYFVASPPQKQR